MAESTAAEPRISFAASEGIGWLRLVRERGHNAIDMTWVRALERAVADCEAALGETRAVLITAAGPSFTVGGDLQHFGGEAHRLADELRDMIWPFHDCLARLAELPVPVVCAVQGPVAGGGLGLLWASDIVIAGEDAKLATGFAALGLSGDGGSSWYLPRLIGLRRAQEIFLENRVLSAAEALEWGLVTRVVPLSELEAEASRTVRRLADGPTIALGRMRALLRGSTEATLREQLAAELASIVRCGETEDARAGMGAFLNGARPTFHGR
ncbi:MAG TPA: enoyl-CoA hydratase-related protein [Solirubrobacteraceae bacterium]|jgi:2-(1,2-epoxy-1,2-dihydrophenyl)acetyl-CoA isomerase|nr:enoyl-CoA hydratase-related protein [Solirubrobacteraceae bacterium]